MSGVVIWYQGQGHRVPGGGDILENSRIFGMFGNIPELSRMFQNIPEFSRMFRNIPEISRMFLNIPVIGSQGGGLVQ